MQAVINQFWVMNKACTWLRKGCHLFGWIKQTFSQALLAQQCWRHWAKQSKTRMEGKFWERAAIMLWGVNVLPTIHNHNINVSIHALFIDKAQTCSWYDSRGITGNTAKYYLIEDIFQQLNHPHYYIPLQANLSHTQCISNLIRPVVLSVWTFAQATRWNICLNCNAATMYSILAIVEQVQP